MKLLDLLTLHFDLHDRLKNEVTVGEETIPVVHIDRPGYLLNRADYQDCTIMTQNVRKAGSVWTTWVKDHTGGKITWVTKNRQYVGRVESSQGDEGIHVVVRSFNPDKVIYDEVIADESTYVNRKTMSA